jgi:NifU-like protein involved in Fe-S cluster formation
MENLLRKSGYSDKAIEYVTHGIHVGKLPKPSVKLSYTGKCGDTMEIYLLIEGGRIKRAKFEAIGCAGAFSAGSALMEMIRNKSLEEAGKLTAEDIMAFLGGVPSHKKDCVELARTTLSKTIKLYRNKKLDKKYHRGYVSSEVKQEEFL